jgi:hypothetical protein
MTGTVPPGVVNAANELITHLATKPQFQSVRVETSVNKNNGEFVYGLVASIHPRAGKAVRDRIPAEMAGFPVRYEPWPTQ